MICLSAFTFLAHMYVNPNGLVCAISRSASIFTNPKKLPLPSNTRNSIVLISSTSLGEQLSHSATANARLFCSWVRRSKSTFGADEIRFVVSPPKRAPRCRIEVRRRINAVRRDGSSWYPSVRQCLSPTSMFAERRFDSAERASEEASSDVGAEVIDCTRCKLCDEPCSDSIWAISDVFLP